MAEELDELLDFDLATLMDMEVITPARKGQTVYEAPASVTVISRETIRRRGYRSLEEVLVMVAADGAEPGRVHPSLPSAAGKSVLSPALQLPRVTTRKWEALLRD